MTQHLDLAPIQARTDAATPGPWMADGPEILVGTPDDLQPHPLWIGETANPRTPNGSLTNASFIAAARTDVPALLAEVTRLRQQLAAAQATGMQKASAMLRRHCPDHSAGTYGAFMACHCPAAEEIDRDADRLLAARTTT